MTYEVTLLPGDGVGAQVCEVAAAAVAATGVDVRWERVFVEDIDGCVASLQRTGVMLKGKHRLSLPPTGQSFTVHLRKRMGVYAIVRRIRNLPGLPARAQGVDVVVFREASEDIYAGFEHESAPGVFESVKVTTYAACERIARMAFDWARANGRRRVTTVHKANILKKSDGMLLRVAREVGAAYPELQQDDVIVDALCMQLVRRPQSFDVLICANLFGDIVSDCAAGMAGGLPVATGVCYAPGALIFENPHGTSSEVVGPDGADPFPALGLSAEILEHFGEEAAAAKLRAAVQGVLADGIRTRDLGGTAGCSDVERAVLARLGG